MATCTGGERGSVLNPKMDRPEVWENMAEIRQAEMARAREILGVEHYALGFVDSGLPEGDPLPDLPSGCFALMAPVQAAEPLVAVIRRVRPHVLTTYDEQGGYPRDHQYHRVRRAGAAIGRGCVYRPDLGSAWVVYYQMGFHRLRYAALGWRCTSRAWTRPTPKGWPLGRTGYGHRITTRVRCSDYFEIRDAALRAHPRPRSTPLVLGAAGDPGEGLADGGLATGVQRGPDRDPGVRPVRRAAGCRLGQPDPSDLWVML